MKAILFSMPLALAACGGGAERNDAVEGDTQAAPADNGAASEPAQERAAERSDAGGATGDATPRPGDGMQWNFSRSVRGPKLAFGEPATDNVRLMLRCAGEDMVRISSLRPRAAPGGRADRVTVDSDGATYRAEARAEESPLGGTMVEADLPVSAAPLERMRGGAGLTLHWGDQRIETPPAGERQGQVNAFFAACRGA